MKIFKNNKQHEMVSYEVNKVTRYTTKFKTVKKYIDFSENLVG